MCKSGWHRQPVHCLKPFPSNCNNGQQARTIFPLGEGKNSLVAYSAFLFRVVRWHNVQESLMTCRDHPFQSFQMPTNEDSQNLKPLSTSKCHCCFRIVLGNNKVDTNVRGKLVNCDTKERNVQKLVVLCILKMPFKSSVINEIENAAKQSIPMYISCT